MSLERRWRKNFLDTMKPRFLPPLWSVDHQKERLDIRAAENRIDAEDYAKAMGNGATDDGISVIGTTRAKALVETEQCSEQAM
jgi:hypothetical protein